jgi:hypothetical protein
MTTAETTVIQVERREWNLCHSERRIRGVVMRYCDEGDGGDGGDAGVIGLGDRRVGWVVVMLLLR